MLRSLILLLIIISTIDQILTVPRRKLGLNRRGDMVGSKQGPKRYRKGAASSGGRAIWPNGAVFYKIDSTLSAHKNKILAAMRQIESKTCIQFQQRTNQKAYIQLFNGDGCYSSVGRTGSRQYLSLGTGCHDIGSAMHEILHALGFYHEHMRSDRDNYITILWNNIENGMRDQFAKVPNSQNELYTKFDFSSIMIYGTKAFSKNGRNTMTPKVRGARMVESHFKRSLSPSDVQSINKLYNCNSGGNNERKPRRG